MKIEPPSIRAIRVIRGSSPNQVSAGREENVGADGASPLPRCCGTLRGVPREPKIVRLAAARAREKAIAGADFLSRHPQVELVYLFGSVADPAQTAVRDIDLAVLTQPALGPDELLRLRADLVSTVGEPFDLVSLNRASVVLAHQIAEHGCCLFARTPEAETNFAVRARSRYWDFKPFLETQWRYARERLKERAQTSVSAQKITKT